MSYIPEYHENYYRVEGTAYNQGKIGIGTINPVQLLHVSGGNFRLDGTGYVNGDLNVTGNLNVYGTTAQFAVSQVIAEDKNLELNVATGTAIGGGNYTTVAFTNDAGAEDGGLILKSTQADKIIAYKTATPNSGWVSNQRWIVSGNYGKDTLQLSDTTANVGLTIATDTNLYRSGSNTLRTDDSLGVVLNFNVDGNTILGDATSDTVSFNARANTNLEPSTNNSVNLGSSALNWGTASLTNLQVANTAVVTGYFSGLGSGTFSDRPITTSIVLSNNPLSVVGSGNSYMQLNIQNRATGDSASADLVITANNGTDNTNFINLGINNSGYNQPAFSNGTGFDGYLFIDGGDLDIGTRTAGKAIEFHAGGTTQDKTIARISESGLNLVSGNLNLVNGNYIRLNNSPVILNTGTTGEVFLHLRANSTRPILSQSEFSGVTFAYQPSFIDKNSIVHLYAKNGLTATDNFGFGSLNPMGTATARNVTGTNFYAATKRVGYATTSSSTAVGVRDDGPPQWMRGGSGFGGFYFKSRFGIGEMDGALSAKCRGFVGLTTLIGNILTSNPSTRNVDMLGIGFDSGDSTWSFFHNSGANNSTKVPLVNYDCTNKSGNFIEFTMYAMPSSGVGFHANIANSGNTFSTGYYATTNLPALGTMMAPNVSLYHSSLISVTGIELDINGLYIESYK